MVPTKWQRWISWCTVALCALLLASCAGRVPRPDQARLDEAADRVFQALRAGDARALGADFDEQMSREFSLSERERFLSHLRDEGGPILSLEAARHVGSREAVYLIRAARRQYDLELTLGTDGLLAGLFLRPAAPRPKLLSRNQTALFLPLEGPVYVVWGGETDALNRSHRDLTMQQMALDLLGEDEAGHTRQGTGDANSDFLCWGRKVLAPAAGIVVEAVDGVHDNEPGHLNGFMVTGNSVAIAHGPGEVSFLAHLMRGSVRVRVGQKVRRGEWIGRCGNSGNSSEPHLHYQLQDVPHFEDSIGIKAYFSGLRKRLEDGRYETPKEYAPIKGDHIDRLAK